MGRDGTVSYYNTAESVDGQWYVFIFDESDVLVSHAADPDLVGRHASDVRGPKGYPSGDSVVAVAKANPEGAWLEYTFPNPATGDLETKHSWVVMHDGLVFGSGWYEPGPSRSQPDAFTQEIVAQAVNLYDAVGRDGTVSYYNNAESIDGQWYVFIFDESDVLVTHAADPDLVGRHASDVLGPKGYPSGDSVVGFAKANPQGAWLEYTFPNPATGDLETKHSWVLVHDGLIFGSGWYEPGPSRSQPDEFTQAVVAQAVNLYDAVGRGGTVSYYNNAESIDGQWYVFIFDESDVLVSHAADLNLVGRHSSAVLGPNGYPSGDSVVAVARANPQGAWLEYTFSNPATGDLETKHSWVLVHDGLVFGSGWYEPGPSRSQPAAFTRAIVGQAVNLYDSVGLHGTVSYYNSAESIDGQWYVFIHDAQDVLIAHAANPDLLGRHAIHVVGANEYPAGQAVASVARANPDGTWLEYIFQNPASGHYETKHSWVQVHEGLIFGSGWYEPGPSRESLSGFTQAFVEQALDLYDAIGRAGTVDYYNTPQSADGQWYVFIADEDGIMIAHPTVPENVGESLLGEIGTDPVTGHPYGLDLLATTSKGQWVSYNFFNPDSGKIERKNTWIVRHDGLFFGSGWYGSVPDIIGLPATGDRAISTGWILGIGLGGIFVLAAGAGTLALKRRRGPAV